MKTIRYYLAHPFYFAAIVFVALAWVIEGGNNGQP